MLDKPVPRFSVVYDRRGGEACERALNEYGTTEHELGHVIVILDPESLGVGSVRHGLRRASAETRDGLGRASLSTPLGLDCSSSFMCIRSCIQQILRRMQTTTTQAVCELSIWEFYWERSKLYWSRGLEG